MEAALRTAYEIVTGREVPFTNLNITPVRGMDGVKEAKIKIEGTTKDWNFLEGAELKVAIAHGLVNANKIMKQVRNGKSPYHFVEIMACPGGCIGGGGQPREHHLNGCHAGGNVHSGIYGYEPVRDFNPRFEGKARW
jgi:iron only hydrogenase large subunit-like protein